MRRKCAAAALSVLLLAAALTGRAAADDSDAVVGVLDDAPRPFGSETPYITQCELGSVVADAIRISTGADVALICMGDIRGDLNQGEVTPADVRNVFAADRKLHTADISPAELFMLLEHSVSSIEVDPSSEQIVEGSEVFDGFCQVSGFSFIYDASAPVGERVLSVTLEDGTPLERVDAETILTLSASGDTLGGGYGYPALDSHDAGLALTDALTVYLAGRTALPEGPADRIRIAGARRNTIVGLFPKPALVIGVGLLTAFLAVTRLRSRKRENDPYPGGE